MRSECCMLTTAAADPRQRATSQVCHAKWDFLTANQAPEVWYTRRFCMRPILEGIRVLDVGSFVFGPAAATVMADFGADVVKIEPPQTGDPHRYLHQ